MKKYHTLLAFQHGRWTIEFGDYSRFVVQQEMADQREAGQCPRMRIITTGDTQAEINAAVAAINAAVS